MNETTRPSPRKFDREFKLAAVDLWRTSGRTQKAVAAELGISDASPQRVQEMATDIAGQRYSDLTQQARFEQAYLAGFKSGMTSPYGTAMMGSGKPDDPRSAGFSLGRDTAISNAAALNVTLQDYGYDHTNVTGFVSLAFEQSEFRPVGSTQV